MAISKEKKPRKLTLTSEQEQVFHYGKGHAYQALIDSLPLTGKRAIEFVSTTGESLHVHHP